jgi:hypothetical protein
VPADANDSSVPAPGGGGGAGAVDADEALLRSCAEDLADAVEAALGPWVERSVARLAGAWSPATAGELTGPARVAGERATEEVGGRLRALLALDVDAQPTGPLEVVRAAVRYPTEVLAAAGVPPVVRDEFAEASFPEDHYDLVPGGFRDLDESVHEPGIRWGAAKAHRILARRRAEGRR